MYVHTHTHTPLILRDRSNQHRFLRLANQNCQLPATTRVAVVVVDVVEWGAESLAPRHAHSEYRYAPASQTQTRSLSRSP